MDHPRTLLNNELQWKYGNNIDSHIRWETWSTGSRNSPKWHATIYIDDMKYGHADAATKGAAQDEAARQAYNWLRRERMTRDY